VVKNGSGVSVIGNQFSGSGRPIDLGGDGATLNDLGDTDAGANHLQNYPVLAFVPPTGSSPSRLAGSLDTDAPGTVFLMQAYAYDAATATYSVVGSQEITTDSNGDGKVLFSGLGGPALFATATNLTTGETSEMSLAATAALRVSSTSLIEGDNGLKSAIVTVTLSRASAEHVSVSYATVDGSAIKGSDYSRVTGTLKFAPGETTKTITIPVISDKVPEVSESFYVQLSGAQGALIEDERGEVTIVDDDQPGVKITKGGHRATWIDADGDRVKLVVSRPMLTPERFFFGWDQEGRSVQSLLLSGNPTDRSLPVSLDLTVEQRGDGDGKIALEALHASERDLGTVRIEGTLGMIFAGDGDLKRPGIGRLTVDSFGQHPSGAESETSWSSVYGGMGSFRVKGDFNDTHLYVTEGDVGSLRIGGNVANALIAVGGTGLSAARVGKVTVKGDWTESSLAVGASAGVDEMFGTEDDVLSSGFLSKIAEVTIGGAVAGSPETENATDHSGFVAGKIAAFQLGKTQLLLSGSARDVIELGETADVTLRELWPGAAK
jgi:hypothetical protein